MKARLILSFLLVAALLTLIGFGIYELIQLNPNKHREQIINWVESRYNLKLKLGLIFPIVYPGIGFELKDVEVDFPDPERTRPELFKAKSIKALLDLNQLFRFRRIQIRDVILYQPEFYVEVGPKEKERFKNLVKPKTEEQKQKEAEAEKTLSRRIFKRILNLFPVEVTEENIMDTNRVLVSGASGIIYDKRDKPKKLRAPMEFGNIDLLITKTPEKNTFSLRVSADHPYNQPGINPLRFEGSGKMFVSIKPLDLRVRMDEAKWGENPFQGISVEIKREAEKTLLSATIAGKLDLHQAGSLLSWAPIKYNPRQDRFSFWGEAEYQYHIQPGENNWEKYFNIDKAVIRNFKIVLYDPKERHGKIQEPLMLGNGRIEISSIQGSHPGYIKLNFPFPYQEPMGKLKPFNAVMEGRIKLARNFSNIDFISENGSLGSNQIERLDLFFARSPGKFSLTGGINLKANDLSEFRQILLWKPIRFSPIVKFINFSGTGRIKLDFRYPGPGEDRFWYQGSAKLRDVVFEPGMVIFPVEKINGELSISPEEISLPFQWLSISGMPFQSDFVYKRDTKDHRARFNVHSNFNELDLTKLFLSRGRKYGPQLQVGETLSPVMSIWRGEFSGNRVRYGKFVADSVKGKWKYKDRMVSFPNLTLTYKDGWFQDGGSWIDFRLARTQEFHFRGHFENFKFKAIMDELFGYDFFVDGRVTGQGYLSGKFIDGKIQKKSLNGYFKLTVRDGELIGYNLGIRILKFLGFKIDEKKYGLRFSKAKTELIFKDGVVYFDDIELRSDVLEAHCAGKVDLVQESVNLWFAVYPLEVLATLTKPVPLIGALINQTQESLFGSYAKAYGPWKNIKIEPYLPLSEKVPKAPGAPAFVPRPPDNPEKNQTGDDDEKE